MPELRGLRYLHSKENAALARFIRERLPKLGYKSTCAWYSKVVREAFAANDDNALALLGCNDRFFLLTALLHRKDAVHPWLFARCREVEQDPDGHIDLWFRFGYKSTIITFAGTVQEILCNPEIKIAIFSVVQPIARAFLSQIKEEFEANDDLRRIYHDVLWNRPRVESPVWSLQRGLTVKRSTNPKEATVEAHGLLDGQPTSRHYDLHVYDDIVTQDYTADDQIKKTTERWEMADNLGGHLGIRKWIAGTRYHFADTYGTIIERNAAKPRIYPATDDGTLNGTPVFLSEERWKQLKVDQRSTISAQMLLNPAAGTDATFQAVWLRSYEIFPEIMNVYIMCDPSMGSTQRSDRTAISVVGIDPAGNKYLLDGVRHRMKLSERYRWLKDLRKRWEQRRGVQLVKVGYERYGQQVDLEVIQEYQQRDGAYFPLEELNTPRQGRHSKTDRIARMEPDFRRGIFYLPAVVNHLDFGDRDGLALWKPWTEEDFERTAKLKMPDGSPKPNHAVGQIIFRPLRGLTKMQQWREQAGEHYRIVQPIKRRDEDNNTYDLTRAFIEEYLRHPYATHDDLLDATSRVFDMEPHKPVQFEAAATGSIEVDEMDIRLTSGVDFSDDLDLPYDA